MPSISTASGGGIYPADWLNTWTWQGQTVSYAVSGLAAPDGAGPLPVLLIHGFGACKEHWRHNLPALAVHRPVFAIDLIGFGASSKPPHGSKGSRTTAWPCATASTCGPIRWGPSSGR